MRYLLVLFFCSFLSIKSQETKIVKILDSNLFKLQDGRIVKLAGIDTPGISHPLEFYHDAAVEAKEYSEMYLLDRAVDVETVKHIPGNNYDLVLIYKKYFLENVNLSTRYLLNGYAKYYDNVDSTMRRNFLEFQETAKEKERGIWQNKNLSDNDTLDYDFIKDRAKVYNSVDSILSYHSKITRPVYLTIPLQLLVGSGFTFLSTMCSLGIGYLIYHDGGWDIFGVVVLGTAVGYLIGYPTAAYLIAKTNNPDLSYWATLGISVGFTAAITALSYGLFPNDQNHFTRYLAFTAPIYAPIIYTNVLAPKANVGQINGNQAILNNVKTHYDYYNSTIIFKMNLFRINF